MENESLKQVAQAHIDLLFAIMTLESGLEMDQENLFRFLHGQAH